MTNTTTRATFPITGQYRVDLATARANGVKFAKQPTKAELYSAIDDYFPGYSQPLTTERVEFFEGVDLGEVTPLESLPADVVINMAALDRVVGEVTNTSLEQSCDDDAWWPDSSLVNTPDNRGNLLGDYATPYDYGIVDTTFNKEFTDDECLGALSREEAPLGHSHAFVMVVILLVFLQVVTRASSLVIALMVMAYRKLSVWYYEPVESIQYFSELGESTLWN